jgi:uncharacterized protein YcbX
MLKVSELYIFPVKSLGGIVLDKAIVTDRGFQYDRRWMLVDHNNLFISQREIHQMALMKLEVTNDGIKVNYQPKNSSFTIPFLPLTDEFADVTVWDDTCTGQFVSKEADDWFSTMLESPCRLVYMPDESERIADQKYAFDGSIVSFADGYPFLLIGQTSLDDLNTRLNEPLPMNRFRPNIVFTGGGPFEEDTMRTFTIGNITFYGVKLCARCIMTTIDQDTIARGKEPLKTLTKYRFKNNKILFGQNLIHAGAGKISIGDQLEVLKLNYEERFIVNTNQIV